MGPHFRCWGSLHRKPVCLLPVTRGMGSAPLHGIPLDNPAAALLVEPGPGSESLSSQLNVLR